MENFNICNSRFVPYGNSYHIIKGKRTGLGGRSHPRGPGGRTGRVV
jgi:hypothetical protein